MKDYARIPVAAMALIVVLRMAIGWQFLYEGLWKKNTLNSPTPWTSEGYLKTAQGPLRDYFRNMTGDPDDLRWLDYAAMSHDWYDYRNRFAAHFQLDEGQLRSLNVILDGDAAADTADDVSPPVRVVKCDVGTGIPKAIQTELVEQTGLESKEKAKSLDEAGKSRLKELQRKYKGLRIDEAGKVLEYTGPLLSADEQALQELVDVVPAMNAFGKTEYLKATTADQRVLADDIDSQFFQALETLGRNSRRLSIRHKLAAELRGNPDDAGVTGVLDDKGNFGFVMVTTPAKEQDKQRASIVYGKIQEYKDLVKEHEHAVATAKLDYQQTHATMLGRKLAGMKAELIPPIRNLDTQLKSAAHELLSPAQLAMGALPPPNTPLYRSDMQVMWGLLVLGFLLISGFLARPAAFAGAVLLLMFYMVQPPWPGLPSVGGTEHSLIINKNLIECFALLAIAALPTGRWFGIDALLPRWGRAPASKA